MCGSVFGSTADFYQTQSQESILRTAKWAHLYDGKLHEVLGAHPSTISWPVIFGARSDTRDKQ